MLIIFITWLTGAITESGMFAIFINIAKSSIKTKVMETAIIAPLKMFARTG